MTSPSAGGASVLIVEDHELAADAMCQMFDAMGYRTRIAGTVATAVAACREQTVDLMLLDMSLPDGSGLDVLATLRPGGPTPRVTVALTGHDDAALQARCMEAGCVAVMIKPVSPRALIAKVQTWLA